MLPDVGIGQFSFTSEKIVGTSVNVLGSSDSYFLSYKDSFLLLKVCCHLEYVFQTLNMYFLGIAHQYSDVVMIACLLYIVTVPVKQLMAEAIIASLFQPMEVIWLVLFGCLCQSEPNYLLGNLDMLEIRFICISRRNSLCRYLCQDCYVCYGPVKDISHQLWTILFIAHHLLCSLFLCKPYSL